jgi:hypothetical protein
MQLFVANLADASAKYIYIVKRIVSPGKRIVSPGKRIVSHPKATLDKETSFW